jgi:DNA-binding CsgD family transcriptional regulator/GAF domain-containing protein
VAGLRKLLDTLARARSARELKLHIMDGVAEPFGAGATGLYLFGPDGNVNELHARGVRDGFILVYEQMGRGSDPILERALRLGEAAHDGTVFSRDGWKRSPLYRECGGPWQIKHYLCVPILVEGRIVGTLNLGRRSEAHPFGPRESAWATTVSRQIAARLQELVREPENLSAGSRPTIEELGRLRAECTQVRLHAIEIEKQGEELSADEAGALWDALAAKQIAALDSFDRGDRSYVLIPASEIDPLPVRRPLTRREIEVVGHLASGLANKEIAYELGISLNTVGAALLSARRKLGLSSRVKLVEAARRLGLAR